MLFDTLRFIVSHPINRGRTMRALIRYAAWQAGSRLVPGAVACEWMHGARFLARPGEAGITGNIYGGLHEFEEMGYLLHVLEPTDLFIDIGANVGSYTILACGVRGARGHCFEPVPATFDRLLANLRLNDLLDRVTPHNLGLSDAPGTLRFSVREDSANHVLAEGELAATHVEVKVQSLDSALQGLHPAMLKIDVEGFETRVLQGAPSCLASPSLHSIVIELNGSGRRYGYDDENLVLTLRQAGFVECRYDPVRRELEPEVGARTPSGNAIFVRGVEKVVERLSRSPKVRIYGFEF